MSRRIRCSAFVLAATMACARDIVPPEPRVATTIEVGPGTATISELETLKFTARVRDQKGEVLTGVSVTWHSDHPEAVTIDSTGMATAAASFLAIPGEIPPVSISATAGSLIAKATVTVLRRGDFNVWPDTNVLYVGTTRALRARILKKLSGYPGNSLQDSVPKFAVAWSSSDPNIITVRDTGIVAAVAPGHARIVAKYENREASAEVYVTPAPTPLRFTSVASSSIFIAKHSVYIASSARGCGLTNDGAVYCWGTTLDTTQITDRCEHSMGGAGGYFLVRHRCSEIPLRLRTDLTFTALSSDGSCGLSTSKRIYCWESNDNGPAPIAGEDNFTAIYGATPVCGLRTDGALVCWGAALGASPKMIEGGVTWGMIADAGGCGLAADSTAYCFGTGTAQRVGGSARWRSIAVSYRDGTCALALDDSVYCGTNLANKRTMTQPVSSLVTYWSGFSPDFITDVCGLSATGQIACGAAWYEPFVDVKLRRFYGHCGIASDDKVYCARRDPVRAGYILALVPGQ